MTRIFPKPVWTEKIKIIQRWLLWCGSTQSLPPGGSSVRRKSSVGAIIDRPWILLKQNPSPQGENRLIFLRKIRKTMFFGGRSMIAPTSSKENRVSRQSALPPRGKEFIDLWFFRVFDQAGKRFLRLTFPESGSTIVVD